jgi:hypothetical protein
MKGPNVRMASNDMKCVHNLIDVDRFVEHVLVDIYVVSTFPQGKYSK